MRPIRLLQATAFVATFDRFAMAPMLVAIAADLHVPLGSVVRAAGTYFLVYGVSQPLWGLVSGRLGRVRTMRLTLLLAGLAAVASACVTGLPALAVTRAVAGGLFGAAYPAALIYLGDTVPADVRHQDVTRLMIGVALGTALASMGAGAIAAVATWRAMFLLTGACAVLVAWRLRDLEEPSVRARPASAGHPVLRIPRSPMTLFVLCCALAEGAVLLGTLTLLPPAMEHAGTRTAVAGLATGVYGAAVFGFSIPVGHLTRRWPASRLVAVGATAAVLGCAALALSASLPVALTAAILLGLAWTSLHSTLQTWATEVLPEARAVVVSLFAGFLFVGSSLAALLASGYADAGRYGVLFAAAAVLAVPLGVAATGIRARWRPAPRLALRDAA